MKRGRPSLLDAHPERRWELLAAANDGLTMYDLAGRWGASPRAVAAAAKTCGVELATKPNGEVRDNPNLRGVASRDFWPAVVEMREQGMTYQRIGDAFGITRERIRQVLNLSGRPDLIGWSVRKARALPLQTCPQCEAEYEGTREFCSRACRVAFQKESFYRRDLPRAERIASFREKGRAWVDVARMTGFQSGPACQSWLTKFAQTHDRDDLRQAAMGHYNRRNESGGVP